MISDMYRNAFFLCWKICNAAPKVCYNLSDFQKLMQMYEQDMLKAGVESGIACIWFINEIMIDSLTAKGRDRIE